MKKQLVNGTVLAIAAALLLLLIGCATEPSPGSDGTGGSTETGGPVKYLFSVETADDSTGSGTISGLNSTANGSYPVGTTVTAEAATDSGHSFLGWFDAASGGQLISAGATYSFTLTENTALYARFAVGDNLCFFLRDIAADGTGSGTINSAASTATGNHAAGTTVSVEATAGSGSFFMGWYDTKEGGNLLSRAPIYTFPLDKSITLFARFDNEIVTVQDRVLEQAIREAIPKLTGALTYSDLASIINLSYDGYEKEKITSLKGIEYLTSINSLDLGRNNISDPGPLKNLKTLRVLDLRTNSISNISALAELSNLTTLNLEENQIDSIASLKKLSSLQRVILNNNKVEDITPLENLTVLRQLDLMNNNVKEIAALNRLRGVEVLYLMGNKITNIEALSRMNSLSDLRLSGNRVTDISVIADKTGLTTLSLANIGIADISALTNLTNLQVLDLGENRITEISALTNMTSLSTLFLNNNSITDITPLANMSGLNELYIRNNRIRDISTIIDSPWAGAHLTVGLAGNTNIPAAQIQALTDKGVFIMN